MILKIFTLGRVVPFALVVSACAMSFVVDDFSAERMPVGVGRMLADETRRILTDYPGVSVVNRDRLAAVMKEKKLSLSGIVETGENADTLRLLTGATHFMTGRVGKIDEVVVLSVKAIDAASGEEVAHSSRKGEYTTGKLMKLLPAMVDELLYTIKQGGPPEGPAGASKDVVPAGNVPKGFVFFEGGRFVMGVDEGAHPVVVKPFHIRKTEVTNAEYSVFCKETRRQFKRDAPDGVPVVDITWKQAGDYCRWFSRKHNVSARLPYECEWEFACAKGIDSERLDDKDYLVSIAWFRANSEGVLHKTGTKRADSNGLFDMLGNAEEWCSDWYQEDYYEESGLVGPKGPDEGEYRVVRGGSAFSRGSDISPYRRNHQFPDYGFNRVGFRVVVEAR